MHRIDLAGFCRGPRILILALALLLQPAFGAGASAAEPARGTPRLATLLIEIWPEYDRPAAALVILRGQVAPDVALPATVSVRIPATSGGPSAVAYTPGAGGNLLNMNYDRADATDFITLKFDTPERFFQIEFYDPLGAGDPARSYSYAWVGDLAVDRLSVILQEPAAASDVAVQPSLDAAARGRDGLRYRSGELGAFPAGKRLDLNVRYSKTDPRTSLEILKPDAPATAPAPSAAPSKVELAIWIVGIGVILGLGTWAAVTWRFRRKIAPGPARTEAGFCRECGASVA